jgi:cation transport regulator ChaC
LAKDKESGWALGYGALMEYNGLAYAWSGQTFARHWGVRLSLALMQETHRYGVNKVSEYMYTLVGGRRRRTRCDGDDR